MPSAEMLIEPAPASMDPVTDNAPAGCEPPLSGVARLSRLAHTLRYHRPGQLFRRGASVVRRRLQAGKPVERYGVAGGRPIGVDCSGAISLIAARKLEQRRSDPRSAERADEIREGAWTFLGQTLRLGVPPDWQSPHLKRAPRLWGFQLQYHEWLLDVAAAQPAGFETWEHVRHWMRSCGQGTERSVGDAWHPYCISRRIPAWLSLWACSAPPEEQRESIGRSLVAQAAFLSRRLERDLGGNHLLENARALVLAGVTLQTPEAARWLDLGRSIIESELGEQLLPHGEHFERSPMYHCQMTEVLEDVRDATCEQHPALSQSCSEAVERMREFTAAILHPDGRIPLLGDSCFGEAPSPPAAALEPSLQNDAASGAARRIGDNWTYRRGGDFLLFDAGPVGPDHLPAHAHADLLTIEASFGGLRFVVDSGTYDYEDGAMRQYCRSTAAHNVLEIDGANQCDVWSRFRMGRRGWPTALECGESDGGHWAGTTHNAYRHLGVSTVGRWIRCGTEGEWVIVDGATGRGRHRLVSRLHLHPDVVVERMSDATFQLEREGIVRCVSAIGRGRPAVASGWYCPRFGERIANPVLELRLESPLPAAVGWLFTTSASAAEARLALHDAAVQAIAGRLDQGPEFRVPLPPAAG